MTTTTINDEEVEDVPTRTPTLEEGTRTLFTKAESREEAIENVQKTADELEEAGVEASVKYAGIDIPEEDCFTEGGAVHKVELHIEKDHLEEVSND